MDTGARYTDVSLMALLFGGAGGAGFPAPVNPMVPVEVDLLKSVTVTKTLHELAASPVELVVAKVGVRYVPMNYVAYFALNGSSWPAFMGNHVLGVGWPVGAGLTWRTNNPWRPADFFLQGYQLDDITDANADIHTLVASETVWSWLGDIDNLGLYAGLASFDNNNPVLYPGLPDIPAGHLTTCTMTVFYAEG